MRKFATKRRWCTWCFSWCLKQTLNYPWKRQSTFVISMLKSRPAWKSTLLLVVTVVTNIIFTKYCDDSHHAKYCDNSYQSPTQLALWWKKRLDLPKCRKNASFIKGWPLVARAMANSHTLGEAGLDLPPPTLCIIYNHLPTIPPLSIQLSKQCTCKYFPKYMHSINTST